MIEPSRKCLNFRRICAYYLAWYSIGSGVRMNRSGFTTVEVIIASALIVALITGGAAGMRQVTLLNQMAASRTSHTEMRSRIYAAISDTGTCAAALGSPVLVNPASPITVNSISQVTKTSSKVILTNNAVAPGVSPDGLIYKMSLRFPSLVPDAPLLPAGPGRSVATRRFSAQLEIRGERKNLKAMGGAQGDVVGAIPLLAEFEQASGKMVNCTVHADDLDEGRLAAGSTHTVRDCMRDGGTPMPTAIGLICRIPVPYAPQKMAGYNGSIPSCASLVPGAGWNNAKDPATGINYNTTFPIDLTGQKCKRGTTTKITGWHSMAGAPVEMETLRIKRGTGKTLWMMLGGTGAMIIVALAVNPLTIIIAAAILAALALFVFFASLFKKCKSENYPFWAQVNGVGCV